MTDTVTLYDPERSGRVYRHIAGKIVQARRTGRLPLRRRYWA